MPINPVQFAHSVFRDVLAGQAIDNRSFDELKALETGGARFRLRGIWNDDAHGGGYTWYVDYMVPSNRPRPKAADIEAILDRGVREDGQSHSYNVEVRTIESGSDHFDMDHYGFYERLPSYL